MSSTLLDLLRELDFLLQGDGVTEAALNEWQARFEVAIASADRSASTWPDVVAQSRALAGRLEAAASQLTVRQEEIRRELALQDRGTRALKGYRPA